jgi:hypothetical protein
MTSAAADKTGAIRTLERAEKGLVGLATPTLETGLRIKAGRLTPTADLRRTIDGQPLGQRGGSHGGEQFRQGLGYARRGNCSINPANTSDLPGVMTATHSRAVNQQS